MSRSQELFFAILCTPFALLLCWFIWDWGRAVGEWSTSYKWAPISGTVDWSSPVRGCGKGSASYFPAVRYSYRVTLRNGTEQQFQGTRLLFGTNHCGGRGRASDLLKGFATGTPVTVFVNPVDVRESVLVRQVSRETLIGLAITIPFTLTLFLYLFDWFRGPKPVAGIAGTGHATAP